MKLSQQVAWRQPLAVIIVALGSPWLAVHLYYEMSDRIPLAWAWVQAFGWLLDISVQWIVVLALIKLLGFSVRDTFVGSGRWLESASLVKVFVLLVLTGLSLDYLWQLPWFAMFPEKLSALSEPNSQTFSDDETIESGSAVLTTLLMLTAGPIIEEIFYRGLLLRTLIAAMPVGWAIAFSSVLFGLYHLNDPFAAALFCAMLNLVYLRTGSLYSCIALHLAYNTLQALMELLTVTFPDFWYRSYDLFHAEAWWLHATVLAVSAALAVDYIRQGQGQSPPSRRPPSSMS
jgi:membrane protease YdiL (CAAX protease family)